MAFSPRKLTRMIIFTGITLISLLISSSALAAAPAKMATGHTRDDLANNATGLLPAPHVPTVTKYSNQDHFSTPANPCNGQGHWKNHPDSWPVTTLTLGGQTYSQSQLLDILKTPPKGDATYILAHKLIGAKLNIALGADDSDIGSTIAAADSWLEKHPLGSDPSNSDDRSTGIEYSELLEDYTNSCTVDGTGDDGDDNDGNDDESDTTGPEADPDGDGLTNEQEEALGTNPDSNDSDGDGLNDGAEVGDPNDPTDTDNDGHIDALDPDDDNDGTDSADENNDPDGNGSPDDAQDTDNDGTPDYLEADDTPPSGGITANGGAENSTQPQVIAEFWATDDVGVTGMMVSIDTMPAGTAWEPFAAEKEFDLSEGVHTIYVKYRDAAGNESPVYAQQITVTYRPLPARISINNGAIWTNNPDVSLELIGPLYAALMKTSNDGGLADGNWEAYKLSRNWSLDVIPNTTATYAVYAVFQDIGGNVTSVVNDTIIYDPVPPTGDVSIKAGSGTQTVDASTIPLSILAQDDPDGSGVSQMRLSSNEDFSDGTGWISYTSTYDWTTHGNDTTVYMQFKDNAGNKSDTYSVSKSTASTPLIFLPIVLLNW